ncbi:MAG TPA: ATP-binding protein [Candidatus Fournierella merdigallinarum]|nr:ATP-binding protein [Candidatus Fournierella merdigallinarum]
MGPQNDWARRTAALVGGECAELLAAPQTPPARAAAYRMLRAARNLELWAALAGGGAPARVMDLAASARALLEAAREVWPLPPALLHVSVCSQPLPVAASEPAFGAVLLNLLCNSLVHGGAKPAVSVRVVRQGSRGVLLVRDWGPGIPHHRQRQALAPFSGAAGLPGLGLGLPLAAAFAGRFGGAFTLESRPGQGVAAALALPLCPVAKLPRPPHAAALLADRYSPVYVQLSPRCILPD